MKTGTVKFYNETKGFGFIIDNESGKDFFVHATGLKDKVKQNDVVSFDVIEGKKGESAINVFLNK
jgi:CspA family cold shock protein